MEFSANRIRSLIFNSNDWGIDSNSYLQVMLDTPIVNPVKYMVRKCVMSNVIFPFNVGVNDCFYIAFQNQPDIIIKVPVPTNQVLYSFDMFAVFLQDALIAIDSSDSWIVSFSLSTNKLTFGNGSSRAFKILSREDLSYMGQSTDNLINYNIGVDDTVNSYMLQNAGFAVSQGMPNNPIISPTEVYINCDLCNNNLLALPGGESRRDCILLLPLSKAFNGVVIFNSKTGDWIPFNGEQTISQFSISVTDRYGKYIELGLPFTLQLDFAY